MSSNPPTTGTPAGGSNLVNSIVDDLREERDGLNVVERHSKATIRKPTERHSKATIKSSKKSSGSKKGSKK